MKTVKLITEFIIVFVLTFVVSAIVSLLWNLIAHSSTIIDWGSSLRLSIIFGFITPWIMSRGSKMNRN